MVNTTLLIHHLQQQVLSLRLEFQGGSETGYFKVQDLPEAEHKIIFVCVILLILLLCCTGLLCCPSP